MSVAIKLYRKGKKHHPFYRIVVSPKRYKANGKYLEQIGTYDPMTNPSTIKIDQERLDYWLSKGAKPTEGFSKLLKRG
ncbi:30S ribosomal protein S16 [Candidatus Roizmanbacteria bacterium CG22_combo_CG10-13_8_21_14_all_35_9]|uniref:Small ribosomal subunit protein bS16 n=4 Tax=Candidatus Roizmaniibacteriota TaxID=1752723 RepID=A0A2M8F2F7_9BACT|nr:MAG: 30S ribosomal protein S16 [Candidatus Roizmanbacteria bacterium CG23_combo_of_CG06-09_8_20_14_all_35_49]PIP62955.1 MAG: 30S ribosomal protein S16 [Candidatus Roizmanbacteria bacterium CG22_combo_CG10-13_8_21_14_all_35_9]PIY70810.1 MAG: 30S ribosomal protein S16 [Candidatus Roizmanbacteria bacterium CG_4_10_14_0_8_um_filter_35_28]PJC33476.1 MAG: 30S ribosomal protein S16 [Candidatus Roizmanbacteria bacterium CG_4_9_14_0_2_um_filter_35_15]PJC82498.1 MAG: 30S ribosomal protein S16 [Candida